MSTNRLAGSSAVHAGRSHTQNGSRSRYVRAASRWVLPLLGLGGLMLGLLLADMIGLRLRSSSRFELDVGSWGDQNVLRGVFEQEADATGATYRWTEAESAFFVQDFAAARRGVLSLAIGGIPPQVGAARLVRLAFDQRDQLNVPVAAAARNYHVALPRNALADGKLEVAMSSAASTSAADPRALAFRLDAVTLGWLDDVWARPTPAMLLAQTALVVVCLALAWRLALPRWSWPLIVALTVALLAWSTSYKLMMAMAWQMRMLALSAIALACVWHGPALLQRYVPALASRREARWLIGITLLALAARVVAVMFPPFGSHDLYIHGDRLQNVQRGTLYLFDRPSEFGGQRTTVPPAFYLLVSPFTLLTNDPGVAIQGVYVLVEGTSALLVGIVARQLGISFRAACVAAIVAALLPIQMTILWWGFGPQIVSQWLLLLLLVLLTRPRAPGRAYWISAGVILTLALLTHNGAVVLGGVALAAYIVLGWVTQPQQRAYFLRWALVLAASGAAALALLYGDVLLSQLRGAQVGTAATASDTLQARIGRIVHGLYSSFRPLGYLLTAASLGLVLWRTRGAQRTLMLAWLLSGVAFLVIDVALGLQVRYAYFVVPLVCLGVGYAADWLLQRRVWGVAVTIALLAVLGYSGIDVLINGAFAGSKPTLTALTH